MIGKQSFQIDTSTPLHVSRQKQERGPGPGELPDPILEQSIIGAFCSSFPPRVFDAVKDSIFAFIV